MFQGSESVNLHPTIIAKAWANACLQSHSDDAAPTLEVPRWVPENMEDPMELNFSWMYHDVS